MSTTRTIRLTETQFNLLVQCVCETEERERAMKYMIEFGNLHYEHENDFLALMDERQAQLYQLMIAINQAEPEESKQ